MPSFTFAGEFFQQYNAARQFRLQAIEQARAVRAQRALEEHRAQVLELSRAAHDLNLTREARFQAQRVLDEMTFAAGREDEAVRRREKEEELALRRRNAATQELLARTGAARHQLDLARFERGGVDEFEGFTTEQLRERADAIGQAFEPSEADIRAEARLRREIKRREERPLAPRNLRLLGRARREISRKQQELGQDDPLKFE